MVVMINSTKNMLSSKFDMKDMRCANIILGIKIIRRIYNLMLSQSHYVDKIFGNLKRNGLNTIRYKGISKKELTHDFSWSYKLVVTSNLIGLISNNSHFNFESCNKLSTTD